MENNLDKYFRDNLSNRKFEPSEANWLAAERLLEANEKRRKRRGIFWWFFTGFVGLSVIVATLTYQRLNTDKGQADLLESGRLKQTATTTPTISLDEVEGDSIAKSANNTGTKIEAKNTLQSGATGNNAGTQRSSTNMPIATQKIENQSIKNGASKLNSSTPNKEWAFGKRGNQAIEQPNSQQIEQHLMDNKKAETPSLAPSSQMEELQFERVSDLAKLADLQPYVYGIKTNKILKTTTQKIEVHRSNQWQLCLYGAQMGQPTPEKGEKLLLGQQAGILIRRNIGDNWFIASGLAYQRRVGSFDATQTANQRNYRFGLEQETLLLRPSSLHYLKLPVLVGLEYGKHQLMAGISLDYLSGVYGETGSYQKQGEPPIKAFKRIKSGWVTSDGYRKTLPSLQFGYHYALTKYWHLGATANYTIGGIVDKNYDVPSGNFRLKEANNLLVGAQLTYHIKFKK